MIIKKYIFLVACLFIVFISIALAIISQNNNTPTDKIKVSVVVPVYNGEKYIKRSAKCLLNQTLKDIEIIFVVVYRRISK